MPPLISFIVPLYNKENFITETLSSIINSCKECENFESYEIIVIDDDSSDLSKEKVQNFNNQHIQYIHQKNSGPSKARNNGIYHSKGRYIAFVDADDVILPAYVKYILYAINNYPEHVVFTASYEKTSHPDYESRHFLKFDPNKIDVISNFFKRWYHYPFCFTSSICIKKDFLKNNELSFPEGIHSGEDQYLWFAIASLAPYVHLEQDVVLYNKGVPGQLTEKFPLKLDYHLEKLNELDRYMKNPFIKRLVEKEYTYVITNNILIGNYSNAFHLAMDKKTLLLRWRLVSKIIFSLLMPKRYLKLRNGKNR